MHPILFRIPLPTWTLPLGVTFAAVFLVAAALAAFGWRRKSRDLLVAGAVLAAFAALGGFMMQGERFTLGPVPIPSYGTMLCVALVVGWHLTLRLAEREGLPRELVVSSYFGTALCALLGARLLYVAANPHEFSGFWDALALRRGGLSAYGGLIGGLLGSWYFLKNRGLELWHWADLAAPGLASGVFFTRIGCYLFGCDFGRPLTSSAPNWLKRVGTFPRWAEGTVADASGSPAWLEHVTSRGLSYAADTALPVHPTQLYEALAGALLLALTFVLRDRSRFRGQLFLSFTFGYGVLRFLIETLRDDAERGAFGPALAVQWLVALGLLAIGVAFAAGPARLLAVTRTRRLAQVGVCLPALIAWLALRPSHGAQATRVEPSISLWIAVLSAIAAALLFRRLQRGSAQNTSPIPAVSPNVV